MDRTIAEEAVQPLRVAAVEVVDVRLRMIGHVIAATEDEEVVLRTFFRNGRLTELPAKRSKRRIVLERIAIEFEPGRHYDEDEVNVTVGRFFPDHATLRRALVDEGFLDRDHGTYWRSGGPVDVDRSMR